MNDLERELKWNINLNGLITSILIFKLSRKINVIFYYYYIFMYKKLIIS